MLFSLLVSGMSIFLSVCLSIYLFFYSYPSQFVCVYMVLFYLNPHSSHFPSSNSALLSYTAPQETYNTTGGRLGARGKHSWPGSPSGGPQGWGVKGRSYYGGKKLKLWLYCPSGSCSLSPRPLTQQGRRRK